MQSKGPTSFFIVSVRHGAANTIGLAMKKLILSILFIFGAATISFAQRVQETVDYMESSAREMSFTHNIMTTPLVADLEVISEKIELTITDPFKDYIVSRDLVALIPTFKAIALTEAVKMLKSQKGIDADIILGSLVDVRTIYPDGKDKPGRLAITISGYPAKYVKFRNATGTDLDLIRSATSISSRMENAENLTETPDHKSLLLKENIQIIK